MELAWYALLGLFFAAYLVLGGYDYGVGLLLARGATPQARRAALNAVGPFFLGNEVWLVAAVGILFGAFPTLEGELLSGCYPAVLGALAGVVLVTAGVQLRGRPRSAAARAGWDRVVVAGSVLAALGWGALLGALLQGVPRPATGTRPGSATCSPRSWPPPRWRCSRWSPCTARPSSRSGCRPPTCRRPPGWPAAWCRPRSPRSPPPPSWACSPTGYAPPSPARRSPYSCRCAGGGGW
ncbi:hypothetical protein Nm8I071_00020 [Nonomuraea sp. TT08I-71]|nr:hypothetical protein Nm8I071_00020 [Nonomuraea sp. TT08I-71]